MTKDSSHRISEQLLTLFGPSTLLTRQVIELLSEELKTNNRTEKYYAEWQKTFKTIYGNSFEKPLLIFDKNYSINPGESRHILFVIQTYFSIITNFLCLAILNYYTGQQRVPLLEEFALADTLTARRWLQEMTSGSLFAKGGLPMFTPASFFYWHTESKNSELIKQIQKVALLFLSLKFSKTITPEDLLKPLYQCLIPRSVRHQLGEFYTPAWLAEVVISETEYNGKGKILDPACGSGIFLLLAVALAKKSCKSLGLSNSETLHIIISSIYGFDLNPLAVLSAQVNYLYSIADLLDNFSELSIPVQIQDSLFSDKSEFSGIFDFVLGNPPWVRWRYLTTEYKRKTFSLWKQYGLFSLDHKFAGLGGGEKDLSMLFTYACSDNYLKVGGCLGFVITQEVFKSKGAGEGFRRFRLGPSGDLLKVIKAHDLTAVKPFSGAVNKTAVLVLKKGAQTTYPVDYYIWNVVPKSKLSEQVDLEQVKKLTTQKLLKAAPIDGSTGSWQTLPCAANVLLAKENAYRAYAGAMIEPYGVFWLGISQVKVTGYVEVENLPEYGKRNVPKFRTSLETDLLFPAIRGTDIRRWKAENIIYVLCPQDPQVRKPYSETWMKSRLPLTYSYLHHFKDILNTRAGKTVQRLASKTAFYAVFGVGTYTVSKFKVVWKIQTADLIAAVVSQFITPFGEKMGLPLNTVGFISTDTEEEAHYLCALLNSEAVRTLVKSYSSAGRGFGTPSVMQYVPLPRFDPHNALHARLCYLSKKCHHLTRLENQEKEIESLELKINLAAQKFFG